MTVIEQYQLRLYRVFYRFHGFAFRVCFFVLFILLYHAFGIWATEHANLLLVIFEKSENILLTYDPARCILYSK